MTDHPQTPLAELEARVFALKVSMGADAYALGETLEEIWADGRYREAGYSNFKDYLVEVLDTSPTTAKAARAVYRHFSAAIAARYGADKLVAGLAWMRETPEVEEPGDIIAADLTLLDDDGRQLSVRFHDATARQIRTASALLRQGHRGRNAPDEAFQRRMESMAAALPPAPGRLTRGGRIQFVRDKGRAYLNLRAIPVDKLKESLELLLAELVE